MTPIEELKMYCSQFRIGQVVRTSQGYGVVEAIDAGFPGAFIRVQIDGAGSPEFSAHNVYQLSDLDRTARQAIAEAWGINAFGKLEVHNVAQRTIRLNEESVEACQVANVDPDLLHEQIDEVYSRPVGELNQEIGGIGLCVLLLAASAGLDADQEENREVKRVLNKPVKYFTARNADKNARGFSAV
jgi:NTP pyrophosphatase (non-canonical NTP hydrolase)